MRYLFYLFFILVPMFATAKEYPMLRYGIEDGLPSNTIYDIYQDADGFIWIGTDKGVVRYNGQKFETFSTAEGLSDNECFFFKPDYNGRLWIGTFNGELCYFKDGIFHSPANTSFLKLPAKASITVEINLHSDSSLTFYFQDDPGFYEIKGETITHFLSPLMEDKFARDHYRHIEKPGKGIFDIYFSDEKIRFSDKCALISRESYNQFTVTKFSNNSDSSYFLTSKKEIFSNNGYKLDFKGTGKLSKSQLYRIYRYVNHEILATGKGLIFDGIIQLLPNYEIYSVLMDKDGDYWVGTAQNGLFKISSGFQNQFQMRTAGDKQVIFSKRIDDKMLYTTKDRVTFLLDLNTQQNKCLFDYTAISGGRAAIKSVQWVEGDNFYDFSNDDNFGIYGWRKSSPDVKKLEIGNLWGVSKYFRLGRYHYFKSPNGIFYYLKDKILNGVNPANIRYNKYFRAGTYAIAMDRDSSIWFSTINNVFRIGDTNAVIQPQFGKSTFREFTFCNNYFLGITHNNQLLISANYKNVKSVFDTIKSNSCTWDKFYPVNDSVLLISTSNYFRVLSFTKKQDKAKFSIRLIEDRMIPYQADYVMIDNERCYFFKGNNMSSYTTDYVLKDEVMPHLKFISLKTRKITCAIKDTLNLKYYDSRSVSIRFAPISFTHHNLVYEYTVGQADQPDNWIVINSEDINLFKLGFGKFAIKVRAKTMSGNYSVPISFVLYIDKPFWASFWFIGLIFLIGVVLIAYLARLGVKANLKKRENELRFLKSEYKALNAMMNPHFIFNSLNSVQGLINNREIAAANEYIIIFSDLIRQNMHNTSNELITLKQELTLVENYLRIEQLRLNGTLMYAIDIEEGIEEDAIMIPPLLIQPLVENAIKHGIWPNEGKDGRIDLKLYENENGLFIEVTDNGIGLNKGPQSDTSHKSYAMTNIHQRLEQLSKIHGLDIKVELKEIVGKDGIVLGAKSCISIKPD